MDKKHQTISHLLARWRGWIQAGAALLTNLHLPNFFKGSLYQGAGKTVCVPGLNCYSCPAASGACPIGSFQAVVGSSKFRFSYYITGFLILLGVLLGRFICGFLCPFGWFQELLHKIPTKKLSTKKLKPLTYLKYAVLLVMVVLLPAFLVNDVGMGDPFFCKYLCPQGVLEGAIPLSLANSGIRAALGKLFTWKFSILLSVIVLSVVFYRPFCKWLCPLGAFYALFNRVSLFQMKVDENKCVSCGKCAVVCPTGARELCGKQMTAEDVVAAIEKDKLFYSNSGGGATFSGGEPMIQPDFLTECACLCKERGITVCIQTASNVPYSYFKKVLPYTDIVMSDFKVFDADLHKKFIGTDNAIIKENLQKLSKENVRLIVRTPVVPSVNDNEKEISDICNFIKDFENLDYYELLEYHSFGLGKLPSLNMRFGREFDVPTEEKMEKLANTARGILPNVRYSV